MKIHAYRSLSASFVRKNFFFIIPYKYKLCFFTFPCHFYTFPFCEEFVLKPFLYFFFSHSLSSSKMHLCMLFTFFFSCLVFFFFIMSQMSSFSLNYSFHDNQSLVDKKVFALGISLSVKKYMITLFLIRVVALYKKYVINFYVSVQVAIMKFLHSQRRFLSLVCMKI